MRLIRTLSLGIIVAVSILLLSYCNGYLNDKFYPYDLTMESPKTNYVVGDKIKLIAKVISDHPATIRVYKDRTKSFALYIDGINIQPTSLPSRDPAYPLPKATDKDEIETIWIGSWWKPFQLELLGQVIQAESKQILFDFGKFGIFKYSNPGKFRVWGYWRPISPDPVDSLEDSTNSIVLSVALPK